jgi:hypothetical protein
LKSSSKDREQVVHTMIALKCLSSLHRTIVAGSGSMSSIFDAMARLRSGRHARDMPRSLIIARAITGSPDTRGDPPGFAPRPPHIAAPGNLSLETSSSRGKSMPSDPRLQPCHDDVVRRSPAAW